MAQTRQGKPAQKDRHNTAASHTAANASAANKPSAESQLQSQQLLSQSPAGDLPESLRESMQQMSGVDLSAIQVHYNSDKPKQLGALAYAEGDQIYLAPGQSELLPHETWHLIQQAEGRVPATDERAGRATNSDAELENEAEAMAGRAKQQTLSETLRPLRKRVVGGGGSVAQLAHAEIKRVEIYRNANEVKIILKNGKTYTYSLVDFDFKAPEPLKEGDPEYQSGQKLSAKHKGGSTRDKHDHKDAATSPGKYAYNWSFDGVKGQPGLDQLPKSTYDLVFYLKGSSGGDGKGKGEGDGEGDKSGEGVQSKKKDTEGDGENKTGEGEGEKKTVSTEELNKFIDKLGGEGNDTDGTALTDEEKKRAGEALADLTEAEQEHFLKTLESLAEQCGDEPKCQGKGLADLLEFYNNLDEADKEALSINQMLKRDLDNESSELPDEVLLNIKTDAKSTAESMAKAQDINTNLAIIQSKITDPTLKKEFEKIDLTKLSELNTLIMIQGILAGGSERLPEMQPVAVELTTNIGKLRDFIMEEIAWLAAEIGATMLFSAITAPVSGGTSLAAGAAAAGYLAIRLNKLRKLIKKIQQLMEVVDKIQTIITTFRTVKDNLEKADQLLQTFEDKRAEVKKLQDMLRKGEATAEQISQMGNLEDELLALMIGSEDKVGMIDKLEPMMDRFFLPEDLTDEELKGLFYDIPDGIAAMEDMLAYKNAVEGGNVDQTVTLSLKGFRAGYLLAPFVGFLTGTINDKLNEIMAEKSIAERLSGFGGRSGKKGKFKGSKTKPNKRIKNVKSNKQKRDDSAKKAAKDSKKSDKKTDKSKGKDKDKKKEDKAASPVDKSKTKWRQMEAEIQAIGTEAKNQGGMTQTEVKKKASAIANKTEYKMFKAKVSINTYSKKAFLNEIKVEDKGSLSVAAKTAGGKATKRKRNRDAKVLYLRPERERHKSLNAAIRETFKKWPEDQSDTQAAIANKLTELKKEYAYPVQTKYPTGKAKEEGKAFVEAEKHKGDVIAWKIMTSLRKGKAAEIIRIDRPGNYWGSKTNPIMLDWKKPAITDDSAKAYKPIYVGPYVAGEVRVKQADLQTYFNKPKDQRGPLADSIDGTLTNAATKTKVQDWKKDPEIKKYQATKREKLPSPSRTTVGVIADWQVKNGHDPFPYNPPLARGNEAGSTITHKFRLFGFYAAEESHDGDHVWEIQLGGPDKVENMWPLDSTVNQTGGSNLEKATVTTKDGKKSKKLREVKKDARKNIKAGKKMWINVKVP